MSKRKEEINSFIFDNLETHPQDIIPITALHFNITKAAVSQYIGSLVESGSVEATGKGRNRRFTLKDTVHVFSEIITPVLAEDQVWNNHIKPVLPQLKENILAICHYGFTEIFNNVIDHSASADTLFAVEFNSGNITMRIRDYGIGIFKRIKDAFNLSDERQAILELSKGKLTTDPSRHSGEGIFFTSRIFDDFSILSGELFFGHSAENSDWLVSAKEAFVGTQVSMSISRASNRTLQTVFDFYAGESLDYAFNKTTVAVTLSQNEGEHLVSRSQAKRILNRIDKFKEVVLDFSKIEFIGRAFADEIFRVYQNQHPEIKIVYTNANKQIEGLIHSIQSQNEGAC